MRLHPVNPAEAIIAPFFDPALSPEDDWQLEGGATTRGLILGRAYSTRIAWDGVTPGETVFTWSWWGQLDVSRYNGFFLQASFPPEATITLRAKLDDTWQEILQANGCNANDDYMGVYAGSQLQELSIQLVSTSADAGAFMTFYLGVHHEGRLADWLAFEQPDVYPRDWPEFIKPETEWGDLAPEVGLYFRADELAALRAKLSREPYREHAERLRREAHTYLGLEPERQIRTYAVCAEKPLAYSARARDRGKALRLPMELCAFFGLIDRDPALIKMALRCLVSLAHTHRWSEGFAEHEFPGSAVNWRSFHQNATCNAVAVTLDWLAGALTPHAIGVVCHSLFFNALSPIKHDFARYHYIYNMNQGVILSEGRISSSLVLNKYWERLRTEIDQAEADLNETVATILNDDGSHGEGPGYYATIMYYMLPSYLMLAQHRGVAPQTLAPPGLLRSADYFGNYLSTAGPCDVITTSDCIRPPQHGDWISMLARLSGDPRWATMVHRRLNSFDRLGEFTDIKMASQLAGIRTLIFGPDALDANVEMVPVFRIHPGGGHATSRRTNALGDVRIQLCGSSATEGHSHQDKGAIVLEVAGESILIDRGVPVYNDPSVPFLKQARMHNLVTPLNVAGLEMQQINPCPVALIPEGNGDDKQLSIRLDCTGAWDQDLVANVVRLLHSRDAAEFAVTDEIELHNESPVVFHLHAYFPFEITAAGAVLCAKRSALTVHWEWPGEVIHNGPELHDHSHRVVYHLAVRSAMARHHKLVTNFAISSSGP